MKHQRKWKKKKISISLELRLLTLCHAGNQKCKISKTSSLSLECSVVEESDTEDSHL